MFGVSGALGVGNSTEPVWFSGNGNVISKD